MMKWMKDNTKHGCILSRVRIAAAAAMLGLAICGCGQNGVQKDMVTTGNGSETTEMTTETEKEVIRIGIASCEGQSVLAEYIRACEERVEMAGDDYIIEMVGLDGESEEKLKHSLREVCDAGAALVIGADAGVSEYLAEYAALYPEIAFAAADTVIDLPNVHTFCYAQEEGYVLAGAAAAVIADGYTDPERTPVVEWAGSIDIPAGRKWLNGFRQGVYHVSPDAEIRETYSGMWELPANGFEPAAETEEQQATAVMYVPFDITAAAGDEMNGNQLYIATASDAERKQETWIRVVKNPQAAVVNAVNMFLEGAFEGGMTKLSLADGGVELQAADGWKAMAGEEFAKEIEKLWSELTEKIRRGELIPGDYEDLPEMESEPEESEAESTGAARP